MFELILLKILWVFMGVSGVGLFKILFILLRLVLRWNIVLIFCLLVGLIVLFRLFCVLFLGVFLERENLLNVWGLLVGWVRFGWILFWILGWYFLFVFCVNWLLVLESFCWEGWECKEDWDVGLSFFRFGVLFFFLSFFLSCLRKFFFGWLGEVWLLVLLFLWF